MCARSVLCAIVLLVTGGWAAGIINEAWQDDVPYAYAANELIVKFRQPVAGVLEKQLEAKQPADGLRLSAGLDELNARYRVRAIRAVFKDFKKHRQRMEALVKKDRRLLTKKEKHILRRLKRAPKGAKVPDLSRIYKIELDLGPGQSLEEAVAAYERDPDVEYAELNYIVSINLTPNDPLYPIQWSLHNTGQQYPPGYQGTADADIDAPEAWDLRAGSSHVIIAVIDTGVDYNHRDLQRNLWVNLAELNGAVGVDDDGNGYVDDVYGYDFYSGDANPIDDHGHGTHCSGTIAARGYNGLDITGICWNAKIMGLKFLSSGGSGSSSDAVSCFYYAVENGADVTSNSWGGEDYSQTSQDAIDYAYSQGVIMVAAAGNDNSGELHFPAAYDHMISVAATDSRDRRAGFSNYGDWVDIAAPGVDVLSLRAAGTSRGSFDYDDYTTIASGTSMACPHVAGVAGLLVSGYPHDSVDQIIAKLVGMADDISHVNPGYEGLLGSGRVNAHKALTSGTLQGGFGGYLTLDEDSYSCEDIISIEVLDVDLVGEAVQPVTVTSQSGDAETVILVHEVNEPLFFTGTISTSADPITLGDGTLQVSHQDIITAIYQDADDGSGSPATAEAFAALDCQGPVISEVRVESVASGGAFITFETDELAAVWVRGSSTCGGPYPFVGQRDTLAAAHTVLLAGLAGETSYYFVVEARDALGNQSIDDNAGACYSFTTTERPITIGLHVPDEYPTIQAGIDAAADGETVWVAVGIYTGLGNRDIDFRGKAITVRSEEGTYFTIIDCNADSSDMHRAFNYVSGESPDSVLDGLTIINGYGPEQGYFGNSYKDKLVGGAIYCGGSSPTIMNCIFRNNRTVGSGGAIYCDDSSAVISNCVFEQWNRAGDGGAICAKGSPLITDCYFTDNKALHRGGAVCCSRGAIRNCTVTGNKAGAYGGGMHLTHATTVENCLISHNIVPGHPGGFGGGVSCEPSYQTMKLINCTIVANWAVSAGGGIRSNLGGRDKLIITNCIIWDNWPGQIQFIRDENNSVVTYNDIQGGWGGEGNIDADPCFADPTNGNYRLTKDSLCIDAGTNQPEGGLPVTDFEGTPRPLDGDHDGNSVADMGAYEYLGQVGPDPVIEVSASQLDIYTLYGQGNPDDQILSIRNWGDGTLAWQISEDCPWLQVSPLSGESTGEFDDVVLSVDVNDMTPGDYGCVLTIWAAGAENSPRTVQVNLHIWKQLLELDRHERHIYRSRGDSCRRSNIRVTNSGIGSMPWQVTWDCPWLVVDPNTGELMGGEHDIAYLELDCNAMLPGEYECVLTFSAETAYNSPQTYQLYVHVAGPMLSVSAAEFEFMGGKESPVPPDQILSISNVGDGTLKWEIAPPNDCNWLQIYPQSGQCTTGANDVTLSVDTSGLDYGSYACELTISDPNAGDSPQVIQVNLNVLGPVLDVEPTDCQFFAAVGGSSPPDQRLSVRNAGCDTLHWQLSVCPDSNWLEVHPSSGESTGEFDDVVLSVAASGLGRGKHTCELTISGLEAANSHETVEVSLIVSDTIQVPTAQYPTIQAAIDAAGDWDVVIVADGIYTGQGNRDLDFSGKSIIVRSANGPANCIVDCQGTAAEPHRGFYFHSGEGPSSVLQGFTITNGYAPFGAGILNQNSSATISDCVFNNNSAAFGGGLYNEDCSATVTNCIFSNNTAFDGAGVDNEYGNPKLINCTFFGNTADFSGGAVLNYETSATIVNSIMWGDSPEEIFVDGGSTAVRYCNVEGGFTGEGNIDVDPCFVDAAGGDYHLLPGSAAIDAGNPASEWINERWPNGFRVNIGAYGNTAEATRSRAGFEDLGVLACYWLTDEPLVDIAPAPDGDGVANFLDFGVFAEYWRSGQ